MRLGIMYGGENKTQRQGMQKRKSHLDTKKRRNQEDKRRTRKHENNIRES